MVKVVRRRCGLSVVQILNDTYSFIQSLQRRGRERASTAARDDGTIDIIRWKGTLLGLDVTDFHKIFHGPTHRLYLL